ncbi:MAG: hypothetical protein LJE68_16640 [Rhodobacter sp.]|nr:hypothetical protein [Rhodobacter sp.]
MMRRRAFLGGFAVLPLVSMPLSAMEAPVKLRDLYNKDQTFSDLALSLEGQRITVDGFMAPPLKAEANFFVLTKRPMATCPFCESSADWPDDILAIYTKRTVKEIPFNVRIVTQGVLELGEMTDPDTGFVSRVRLVDAKYS